MKTLACIAFTAASLVAADATVGGPVAGFLNAGGAIRPVLGVLGGATFGDAIAPGFTAAAISNATDAALGCANGKFARLRLSTGELSTADEPCPISAAFSPRGAASVLVFEGAVKLARGDQQKTVATPPVSRCAVNDAGDRLVCSASDGLFAISPDVAPVRVLESSGLAAYFPDSNDAVVSDGARLYLLNASLELVPTAEISEAVALATLDNDTIAVAVKNKRITVLRRSAEVLAVIDASVLPTSFNAMNDSQVLHVARDGDGPEWLLVRTPDATRLMFVPAPEAAHE